MSNQKVISKDYFIKRLVDLCLRSGLSGLPTGHEEQHILLKSAVLTLGRSGPFTEKEIDAKLQFWISEIVGIKGVDHVTLRRYLIDARYLTRNKDCSWYQVPADPQSYSFDVEIDDIDVASMLQEGRNKIALRKKEYWEIQSKYSGNKT